MAKSNNRSFDEKLLNRRKSRLMLPVQETRTHTVTYPQESVDIKYDSVIFMVSELLTAD
jgi:hypothetical protein